MTADNPVLSSGEDEIDLLEVLAFLQRRWRLVVGGGLLGLALALGAHAHKTLSAAQVQASLIVDVAQGPCLTRVRRLKSSKDASVYEGSCPGELETMRLRLQQLAKSLGPFDANVDQFFFDDKGTMRSHTHLALTITGPSPLAPQMSAALAQVKQDMTLLTGSSAEADGFEQSFGSDWIHIQKPTEIVRMSPLRSLALGLLGGVVAGAGSALIADRLSNRVFSQAELLRRLGQPLYLGLPSVPWNSRAVPVLVGQLATQLDQNLSWSVLSIARHHEAVAPLTQLLQQKGGSALQCRSADPLLAAVLRMKCSDRPTGLLLVVEPGFNSARALEEARLLVSQMSTVQAVGVVLIGAPLSEELSSSVAG